MTNASPLEVFISDRFNAQIRDMHPAGGGCINQAFKVSLSDGRFLFLKKNRIGLLDMFEKEARGLELLRQHGSEVVVPKVEGVIADPAAHEALLILSFVEEGRPSGSFHDDFGAALADLHQTVSSRYGLDEDNYIGKLPQNNEWKEDWISFFIENRIMPQWEMARNSGFFQKKDQEALDRFFTRISDLFPDEPASLLHGDLWGGNYLCNTQNKPVLIDPAVYYGHREIELAFTTLFGGFSSGFYDAYQSAWPLQPGFNKRTDLYNLYPLLVHVNLFGGSYAGQVSSILRPF
ncbi:fructosamine kinase family protein [Balneolaceae bacterium ANBcel3]|nr:fructosamine kinase family protein [Balneolaceae bacterium ANBcel3]